MPDLDPRDAAIVELRGQLSRTQRKLARARAKLRQAHNPAGDATPEQIRHLHALFTATEPGRTCGTCGKTHPGPCESCGGLHARKCPRVREIEYERHGEQVTIKRVRFWRKWDTSGVLWPDDLPPVPEDAP